MAFVGRVGDEVGEGDSDGVEEGGGCCEEEEPKVGSE